MSVHAIDEAMLASRGDSQDTLEVCTVVVNAPYSRAKGSLLTRLALANGCRCVHDGTAKKVPNGSTYRLVGFASTLRDVESLFVALSLHATRSMLAERVPEWENAKAFRRAFLLGYAGRIGDRLDEAAATAKDAASETHGSGMALVLVERDKQVDAHYRQTFPRIVTRYTSSSSHAGDTSGRSAANRANLGQRGLGGARLSLTR